MAFRAVYVSAGNWGPDLYVDLITSGEVSWKILKGLLRGCLGRLLQCLWHRIREGLADCSIEMCFKLLIAHFVATRSQDLHRYMCCSCLSMTVFGCFVAPSRCVTGPDVWPGHGWDRCYPRCEGGRNFGAFKTMTRHVSVYKQIQYPHLWRDHRLIDT